MLNLSGSLSQHWTQKSAAEALDARGSVLAFDLAGELVSRRMTVRHPVTEEALANEAEATLRYASAASRYQGKRSTATNSSTNMRRS